MEPLPLSDESSSTSGAGTTTTLEIEIEGAQRLLQLRTDLVDGSYDVLLDGQLIHAEARMIRPGILSLLVNGHAYRCLLDESAEETSVQLEGRRYLFRAEDLRSLSTRRKKHSPTGGIQTIKAPMPGRIIRVLVGAGEHVVAQQALVAIEAMKMQNELKASRAGKVIEVRIEAGATVRAGETLVRIES
ncbi:Biotin carboxyl carrier protein of acetyl-CoA carboxylase [Acidisarcina polymorpha]|uniref:Biotin carboxyl carrier protein of acetyl-CoA carboxylase n=2 Tax=Acidisarcina polymorpha TaxID=2211140 RepID=A0A2Z5FZ57_9BACT|nr:Biotin carboxyl carrier protein of acetyl-CoA carboxylase [Acidisarcina polymorpha]